MTSPSSSILIFIFFVIIHIVLCSIASQLEEPDFAFEELLDILVATAIELETRTIAVAIKLESRTIAVEVGQSAHIRGK
jgi:hypothetical protein